ncbi:hypothetical protein [Lysinibacter sp. HNR]|uniref:hypothetical protein n=1 Tax=Lysinibacter sp. HNR TaxID=3031408 RepID=UPI0024347EE9|nr:hypothetical protein [Lysinibacter sp. HNR]WGD37373.1 hypothetical protein FrondiHNR_00165 [Lysinibacter sp. HNR]
MRQSVWMNLRSHLTLRPGTPSGQELLGLGKRLRRVCATQAEVHEEVAQLRGMPAREAAKRIEAQCDTAEQARLAREACSRKLHSSSHDHDFGTSDPHRDSLGL